MSPSALEHALDYGKQEVPVFPCRPDNKHPLIDAWNVKATSDRQQIEAWWQRWPQAMIGMPTGMQSGVCALDVDIKNGHDGPASLNRLGRMPPTAVRSRTASGGTHYLFRMPDFHVGNSASQLGDGLDVRGIGGYVILPGSVNADGVPYEWVAGDLVAARGQPPPAWLADQLRPKPRQSSPAGKLTPPVESGFHALRGEKWAHAALAAEVATLRSAGEGRRNHTLNRAAFRLGQVVAGGYLGEDRVHDALMEAATEIGLVAEDGERQCEATIASGLAAGLTEPRHPAQANDAAGPSENAGNGSRVSVEQYVLRDGKTIPPRKWLARGMLLRRNITELVASAGVGKSTFGLTIAAHLAAGRSFARFAIRRRHKMAFLTVEEDREEIDRRLAVISQAYGFTQDDFAGHLFIIDIDDPLSLAVADRKTGVVSRTPALDDLETKMAALDLDAFMVDPFVEIWEGEENDATQVRAVGSMLRSIARTINPQAGGAACLLTHHVKKGTVTPGDLDAGRGSSAMGGLVRLAFTLIRMDQETAKLFGLSAESANGKIRLDNAKASYMPQAANADWFEFASHDLNNGTAEEWEGDSVGVLRPWTPPGIFSGISHAHVASVLDLIEAGIPGATSTPGALLYARTKHSKDRWVGQLLMDEFGCEEGRAKAMIEAWMTSGLLFETTYSDESKRQIKGLKVDPAKRP